jgi:gluconolactonase
MVRWLPILALAACGGGGDKPVIDGPLDDIDAPATPIDAPMFDPLVGVGTAAVVQGGYMFTEGPQWREATSDLVFSDIPANTIFKYTGTGAPTLFKMPSNNSNGLAIDGAGKLVAAEHGSRSVTRDGTAIATIFETKKLNSPNDVIVADDGTIYFTDPPYGIPSGQSQELTFNGVFRIAPNGTLTAEYRGSTASRPNGIGISPDGKTVYVADTQDGKLWKYPVGADGALGAREMLAMTAGGPDGLAIDTGGNIFVTTSGGVEVFSPTGQRWGNIATPIQPANCAFGDADHKTLYITARTTLYRVRLANAGLPRR